jgi:cell division protein FtsI/penicillin-binding protein 2
MSFHPNDVARRARAAAILSTGALALLCTAFFRTQVLGHKQWVLQAEENRLREIPIPAPRGTIFDRNGKAIAENVVGYTVSVLAQSEDSLRGTLRRLANTIPFRPEDAEIVIRRNRHTPLSDGAHAAHGDPERRVVRRDLGARGASGRVSKPDHHVHAEAALSRWGSRDGVRGLSE